MIVIYLKFMLRAFICNIGITNLLTCVYTKYAKEIALFSLALCPPQGPNARKLAIFQHRDGIC